MSLHLRTRCSWVQILILQLVSWVFLTLSFLIYRMQLTMIFIYRMQLIMIFIP